MRTVIPGLTKYQKIHNRITRGALFSKTEKLGKPVLYQRKTTSPLPRFLVTILQAGWWPTTQAAGCADGLFSSAFYRPKVGCFLCSGTGGGRRSMTRMSTRLAQG